MAELSRIPPGGGPEGVDNSAYEERIAQLERVIAEKEHAVLRAVLSSNEVQQQLETSRAETRALAAQLELARERPSSAAIGEEISRMSGQFAQARKSLDREREQTQAESVAAKARLQQVRLQLDHERQMRRADGAAYTARIASLQRDLAGAQGPNVPPPADAPRSVWASLAVCALGGALLVCVYVGWLRVSKIPEAPVTRRAPAPAAGSLSGTVRAPGVIVGVEGNAPEHTYDARVQPAQPTQQEPLEKRKNPDPSACDFQWVGGLPTILYRGKDSLTTTLSRCTQAPEDARAQ